MNSFAARGLAVFENRSDRRLKRLADSKICHLSQWVSRSDASLVETAVFGRRDAGGRLEGAIERAERLKTGIHRNGDDGDLGLCRVGQRRLGLLDPVVVEEDIEVAIA